MMYLISQLGNKVGYLSALLLVGHKESIHIQGSLYLNFVLVFDCLSWRVVFSTSVLHTVQL